MDVDAGVLQFVRQDRRELCEPGLRDAIAAPVGMGARRWIVDRHYDRCMRPLAQERQAGLCAQHGPQNAMPVLHNEVGVVPIVQPP